MLLVADVGNTNTKIGVFDGDRLLVSWVLTSRREQTADEYGVFIETLLRARGISASDIHGIAISNVLPPVPPPRGRARPAQGSDRPRHDDEYPVGRDLRLRRARGRPRRSDARGDGREPTGDRDRRPRRAHRGGRAHGRARRRPPEAHGAAAPLRGSASRDARALTRAAPGGYTHTKYSVTARGRSLYTAIGQGTGGGLRGGELMGMWVGRGRKARVAYGFDDIALVPGTVPINPNEVDIARELKGHRFELPIIAAAMDGVVGPRLAIEMGRLGGLAVLNLEGIFARYANPEDVLDRIVSASQDEATKIIQSIYGEPIKEAPIHRRIREIKKGGGPAVVSSIPQRAERFAQIAQEAGADIFVVQSTVTTARHIATEYTPVDFRKLKKQLAIPLIIGNVVTYEACLELVDCGADALLIGVGPGAACTSREVLGLGVPQVTATADAAAARDYHYKQRGRYVPIITDGGMMTGGEIGRAHV